MAAMWTDIDIATLIRHLLGESTAKHWTDAEITLYKEMGISKVNADYWYLLFPIFKTYADGAIVAGTATVTIPADAQHNTVVVMVKATGKLLYHIEENERYKFDSWDRGDPVAWCWKGGDIELFPTPGTSDTDYLKIYYMTYRSAVTDFPDPMRPLIAIEATIMARQKDDNITAGLMEMQRQYVESITKLLAVSTIQEPKLIGDYELQDSYTANIEE